MPSVSESLSAARGGFDAALTMYAKGWKMPMGAGSALFPRIEVPNFGATIERFGREAFRARSYRRAPGAAFLRQRFGITSETVTLKQHGIMAEVTRESLFSQRQVPGLDRRKQAVDGAKDALMLEMERLQAGVATTAANYAATHTEALAGTSRFDNRTADAENPLDLFEKWSEIIRGDTGVRPTHLILGAKAWSALSTHRKLLEMLANVTIGRVSIDHLRDWTQIPNIVIANSVYLDEGDADDAGMRDVWGKVAVLAYVNPETVAMRGSPNFGATFTLQGTPIIDQLHYDYNTACWLHACEMIYSIEISTQNAGFLATSVVD